MNLISNILYWISTGLLVPVILLLIFFFIRSLILIGGFLGQYLQERRTAAALYGRVSSVTAGTLAELDIPGEDRSLFGAYARRIACTAGDPARIDLLLSEYEVAVEKNIATSKTLTKMGPILGLMGTLIPMGPALVGLAAGDIASMAYNMQVAFATTVVGLVVSAIGFITGQARERWAHRSIALLEYLGDVAANTDANPRP